MNERLPYTIPEIERPLLQSLDYYKLTMGQIALERHRDTEVTFRLQNRNKGRPLSDYVNIETLRARLERIKEVGFTAEETAYLGGIKTKDNNPRFDAPYLGYLTSLSLTDVSLGINPETQDLAVSATGEWPNVSLWETVVMSEVSELYYQSLLSAKGISLREAYATGNERLSRKIDILKSRPDIKIVDFGTRRRFSAQWHEHVLRRLIKEVPENLIGTSNPWFAHKYGIKAVGTYAHEMPMVYAALADREGRNPLDGQQEMLKDWEDRYDEELYIALPDTFTSELFFADFTPEQLHKWRGFRHDSGDPFAFGERVISLYESAGIDPTEKTIIFSDGLKIETIVELADYFKGRIDVVFGWGSDLMNDLGFDSTNTVMKAVQVFDTDTVKHSDTPGKYTGPVEQTTRYSTLAKERIQQKMGLYGTR